MSSAKGPPGPDGPREKRRRAPTIDLKATEVANEPVQPMPDPAVTTPLQPDPVPPPPPQPERTASAEAMQHAEPPPPEGSGGGDPPPGRNRSGIAWLPPEFPWPLAAAGVGGAVLVLIVVSIVGMVSGRDGGSAARETQLDARLARVEKQLRDIAARPVSQIDPKAIDELAGRLARLEAAVATPRSPMIDPALANRIAMLEGEVRALGERVGVLLRRNDEIAVIAGEARKLAETAAAALDEIKKAPGADVPTIDRKEIDALSTRIAGLEKSLKSIESQLGKQVSQGDTDRIFRLLAVMTALDAAVVHGRPFVAELDAARPFVDAKTLALLEPFAKTGVPTPEMLARELRQVLPAVAKAAGSGKSDGSFLERLLANAGKIIRVRPIDEVAGDDPAAVLSRIEARAAQADIAGALAEFGKLPDAARAPAQAWIARAKASNAAVDGIRRFIFGMAAPAPFGKTSH